MKNNVPLRLGKSSAFSLVEVVIALGLVTFSLVSILGLFTVGLTQNRDSSFKLDAANSASSIISLWLANPNSEILPNEIGESFVFPKISNPGSLPQTPAATATSTLIDESGFIVSDPAKARFRAHTRVWRIPSLSSQNTTHVRAHLILSWPPQAASLQNAAGIFESARSVSVVTPPIP